MHPVPNEPRTCQMCGTALEPGNRYCPNCGTPVPEPSAANESVVVDRSHDSGDAPDTDSAVIYGPPEQLDPSTLETRQFQIHDIPVTPDAFQAPTPPQHESTANSVPPESGNRTLWIILAIVAAIVLICCCILPLGILAVANIDTAFQDEIRSFAQQIRL